MNPDFPITTKATWTRRTDDIINLLWAEAERLTQLNLTDGYYSIIHGPELNPDDTPVAHAYRHWANESAANEWITFNNNLNDSRLYSIFIDPDPPENLIMLPPPTPY